MSLFQAREWWMMSPDGGSAGERPSLGPLAAGIEAGLLELEESRCICVGSLLGDEEDDTASCQQVVVGSLTGLLQVYQPSVKEEANNNIEDLLMEQKFASPILQLAIGKFVSGPQTAGSSQRQLAVLHPRQLSVYGVGMKQGTASHGDSYSLNLIYQHNLSRSSHSFVTGNFGGVRFREYIAVMSLDGVLSIFEQDTHAFSRFIPNFLLPGPMCYVKRSDSFVVVTSDYSISCFKYQTLATSGAEKTEQENMTVGRKITPDWTTGIGEPANDIQVIQSTEKEEPSIIIVATRQSITAFLDTGYLLWCKRLDYHPLKLISYRSYVNDNRVISLVTAADTNSLMVYDNTTLKWATQLPFQTVSFSRGKFWDEVNSGLREGLLVLLGTEGQVSVCYLGTDPTLYTAPPPDSREVNYDETDRELAKLTSTIRQSQKEGGGSLAGRKAVPLKLDVNVSNALERCTFPTNIKQDDFPLPMVKLTLNLSTPSPLTRVRIVLMATYPIALSSSTFTLPTITNTESVTAFAFLSSASVVSTLEVSIVVTFFAGDTPQTLSTSALLPLGLVVKPSSPVKDADYKVTLSTNKTAVSLLDLFPEFVLDSTLGNAAGFQLYNGPTVTVLSSKTSQRYRLQSDNLASLWLLTSNLEKRLREKFSNGEKPSDFECSYSSSLPLQEFFSEIDAHFGYRRQLKTTMDTLTQRTAQFRAIERRLLTRFKDKTPTPLTNLDMLLEGTYRQIQMSFDQVQTATRELEKSSANLACIIRLLLMLARLSLTMTSEELDKLEAALTPIINDNQEEGWEECTDAALTFLLRTALAKPGRENQGATPITLEYPKDTTRLKKHVSSVIERVTRGAKIQDTTVLPDTSPFLNEVTRGHEVTMGDSMAEPVDADQNDIDDPTQSTPIGSRFGEAGERIRSARIRSARSGKSASRPQRSTTRPRSDTEPSSENMDDIPPDGPVNLEELDANHIPQPLPQPPKTPGYGIESPLDSSALTGNHVSKQEEDDDIW